MREKFIDRIDWSDNRGAPDGYSIVEKIRGRTPDKRDKEPFPFSKDELENAFVYGPNPVAFRSQTDAKAVDLDGKMGYVFGKVGSGRYITVAGIIEPDGRLIVLTVNEMKDSDRVSYQSYFSRRQLV